MYKRNAQGWSKHLDFIVLDEICLQAAFLLAAFLRLNEFAYDEPIYRSLAFVLVLIDAVVLVANNSMHNVLGRGYYLEAVASFKHCFYVFALATIYMFAMHSSESYSRIVLFLTFLLHLTIGYGLRVCWKKLLPRRRKRRQKKISMLVVASPDTAEEILGRLENDDLGDRVIVGVVLTEHTEKTEIAGHQIVSELEETADYICREWVDCVYIDAPLTDMRVVELMDKCSQMAVPVHYHVPYMSRSNVKRFSEKIGGTTVLTTSINYATPVQTFLKRCFDILGGCVGSLIALLIMAIVGPKIKKASPGPILFKQQRIGKNGKRFAMYKIRSMYMDAEERKKELMAQNRVKDGMMFKLDFDPRIIGNEILPDGTKKTGIGEFIRKTSLDEFPQFFNVLRGEMSLVGDRVILGQTKKKPVFMRLSEA